MEHQNKLIYGGLLAISALTLYGAWNRKNL